MAKVVSMLEQNLKNKQIENSSDEFKRKYRAKTIEDIQNDLENKKNRFIFYCPDIAIVNSLTRTIYEVAYAAKQNGYNTLILHEMEGFKPKWLFEQEEFKHLKSLGLDSIIKRNGKKSKKTKSNYSFKPSDSLIIPDQFQEMLENLVDVKLIQKIILISSFSGLSSLIPGGSYENLGIEHAIFTDKKLAIDYKQLFPFKENVLSKFLVRQNFFTKRNFKDVLPLITISNIGNNELTNQVINIFYNKYPNFRIFNFRLLDRDSLSLYKESLTKSAIVLFLDKSLGSKQVLLESLAMGCPIGISKKDELEPEFLNQYYVGDTAFEIAKSLAEFCAYWLQTNTKEIDNSVELNPQEIYEEKEFDIEIENIFNDFQENRILYFNKIKASFDAHTKGI